MKIPYYLEYLLEDLAQSLQVSHNRYEDAERSYKSVAHWLQRPESKLHSVSTKVYIQGSFRLGTAIRPMQRKEDYDIDLVCELELSKAQISQSDLKTLFGNELRLYAKIHGMKTPVEGRRCWTLDYADNAQFHMDILPAIPDASILRKKLKRLGHTTEWVKSTISITDTEHPKFEHVTIDWPHSNPKGYANWFHSKMKKVFDELRLAIAKEKGMSIEDIPKYKVRTPLQSAIQILKHHRDKMFSENIDNKPISIILTTLAARAYGGELTISDALNNILNT
ncbi:MAG: nucleotidyltransferase, partial [Rhodobacteraceae bacterium]|nr:nucleotidyltransferase [Paracoccaceae bacterium]